jgi:hypothetical protein
MTKLEKFGVVGGAGDTEGLHSVIRGMARPAISTPSVPAARATFEGGA